jgi:hypothetical protein
MAATASSRASVPLSGSSASILSAGGSGNARDGLTAAQEMLCHAELWQQPPITSKQTALNSWFRGDLTIIPIDDEAPRSPP